MIHTMTAYNPKATLPLYTSINRPEYIGVGVGQTVDVRVDDVEKGQGGGEGPDGYNYIHKGVVVGKRETTWGEASNILKAFDANSRKAEIVGQRTHPAGSGTDACGWDDSDDIVVVFILREDKAKEFILENEYATTPAEEEELGKLEFKDYED